MLNSVDISGRTYKIDPSPIDISVPLRFNGPQPNAYGVPPASSMPCAAAELVGDTRQGGSCNFEEYTLIPHCNGTHTECVGHITRERISVRDCLQDVFIPAWLITVAPSYASDTHETYSMTIDEADRVITRERLEPAVRGAASDKMILSSHTALIVRTLPNDDRKLTRHYLEEVPPYFTTEAIEYIAERGFKHLLVDLPSIDRLYDEGKLSNHRIFWNVDQGRFETNKATRLRSTITELIFVPNRIEDGQYLLNLQIAPFASDASPSRPILFRVEQN